MGRIFGHIPNVVEGDSFDHRIALSQAKVHRPTQAGISGSENEGADSIVISGGYEDDEDLGNIIIYTGHGGRSEISKEQVADQTLTRGNKALAISCENNLPVRVIRGANERSEFSPEFGYRYDGLYLVEEYCKDKGKSGFIVWKFRLVKLNNSRDKDFNLVHELSEPESNYNRPERKQYVSQRIVRDTKTALYVKELYDYKCQICNIQIATPVGYYAESAHIKALGNPHNGPDTKENIICLCPNHHIMFDLGMISIDENLNIIGEMSGKLNLHPKHEIDKAFIAYHREHFFKNE
ncbi:YDG/SRA domain-containing protein [Catalinimonas niigatensis]|uniref:YDG/SRA domain-containing protein n=1 Tax=Catalinimonas niigatensis TaxID=1397264 RepID=UPI0026660C8B|nr:YDG/SRA domain-containing protein [Catalinimonas niigatensis]WPP48659.1 YDG/SRA domain-containing protein [Catalinimonas niigatensis]